MKFASSFYPSRIAGVAIITVLIISLSCGSDPEPNVLPVLPEVNAIAPTSGENNTPVVITGTNFSAVPSENKVTFNGVEAIVTAATATQLNTTVPPSATTGAVVVKVQNTTAANQFVFTVESPAPQVNQIAPAFGVPNTSVVITGINFSTVTTENNVSFNGKEAAVTAATATQITAVVPLLSSTGPVVVSVKGKTAANQPVFTVLAVPVLTTSAVTDIVLTTATCGGNITSEGGSAVTARGICWSTAPLPTIANSKTTNGSGLGAFTSSITGLTLGITYYVRAYATSSIGTAYGDQVTFKSLPILGQTYQGGIIAYIFQLGDPGYIEGESHGLIVASDDQGSASSWSGNPVNTITGATGTALGTGKTNTLSIMGSMGGPYHAAKACFDLVSGIYEDWNLPSKDELNKLYAGRAVIGNMSAGYYWSSTESTTTAWIQNFSTGVQSTYAKGGSFYVRAVRYF
ncbi:IPT/TIG domain-containing protein [Chryseolinea sp. H1M3-3]|uniref:IPT/TIG domain-containing protein n=1 Tax=Chryseolinea sp. H1M3-3 TaxID=3034144 RepID=UPI0023EAC56C|nr:IPT/TIG domain-containing protein [Chryseolinea sp. H1M3-3]